MDLNQAMRVKEKLMREFGLLEKKSLPPWMKDKDQKSEGKPSEDDKGDTKSQSKDDGKDAPEAKGGEEKDRKDEMSANLTFAQWLAISEDCGEPHKPRKMQKINDKLKKSKGVRSHEDDLSSDYKGHIKMNGDVEPFKHLTKNKKPVAPVA